MTETAAPAADHVVDLARARALVADVVHDDICEAEPEEDLRDYGLDSIRLLAILDALRGEGLRVRLEDLAARPTLGGLADAIAAAAAPIDPGPIDPAHPAHSYPAPPAGPEQENR